MLLNSESTVKTTKNNQTSVSSWSQKHEKTMIIKKIIFFREIVDKQSRKWITNTNMTIKLTCVCLTSMQRKKKEKRIE